MASYNYMESRSIDNTKKSVDVVNLINKVKEERAQQRRNSYYIIAVFAIALSATGIIITL